jgi:hypothetical protein
LRLRLIGGANGARYISSKEYHPTKRTTDPSEDIMRNISTIGLLSAAAALSFFCARAANSDPATDTVALAAIAPAR